MVELIAIIGLTSFCAALVVNIKFLARPGMEVWRVSSLLFLSWSFMFMSKAIFAQHTLRSGQDVAIDDSSIIQLLWVGGAVVTSLFMLLRARWVAGFGHAPVVLLMIYALFGLAGVFFSPAPLFTTYKVSLVIIDGFIGAAALGISMTKGIRIRLFDHTLALITLAVAASLLGVLAAPHAALIPNPGMMGIMLYGVFPVLHPNELGMLSGIVFMVAVVRFKYETGLRSRLFHAGIILMSAAVVVLAQSRTSIAAIIISMSVIMWYASRNRAASRIKLLLGMVVLAMLGFGILVINGNVDIGTEVTAYLQRGQKEGGFETLADRASAWENVGWRLFMESPLIGNGFDSGVRYSGLLIGHLHNSYFQILANSGLLGFLPWLAMLMIVVYKILHQLLLVIRKKTANLEQEKVAMVLFVTLIALLGRSLTGSVLVSHSWSLLLFLSMILELAWLEGKLRRGSHDKNNRPIGPARSTRLPKAG